MYLRPAFGDFVAIGAFVDPGAFVLTGALVANGFFVDLALSGPFVDFKIRRLRRWYLGISGALVEIVSGALVSFGAFVASTLGTLVARAGSGALVAFGKSKAAFLGAFVLSGALVDSNSGAFVSSGALVAFICRIRGL